MFSSRTRSPRGTPSARPWLRTGLVVIGIASIGCQAEHAGMTLPSGKYMYDDVQYFPPGPEFKLSREAAAMKAYKNEQISAGKQPVPAVQGPPMGPGPGPMAPGPMPADAMP